MRELEKQIMRNGTIFSLKTTLKSKSSAHSVLASPCDPLHDRSFYILPSVEYIERTANRRNNKFARKPIRCLVK